MATNDHTPQRGSDPSDATRPVDVVPTSPPGLGPPPDMEVLTTGRPQPVPEAQPAAPSDPGAPGAPGGPTGPTGRGAAMWSRFPRRPGPSAGLGAAVAAAVLLVGAAFAGGYAVAAERADAGQVATQPDGQQPPGLGGRMSGQGTGSDEAPGSGAATGVVIGQIGEVDGDSFTVTTARGQVTVTTSDATQVSSGLGGSVDALEPGQIVVVQGTLSNDGIAATLIVNPAGLGREGDGTTSSGGSDDFEESQ